MNQKLDSHFQGKIINFPNFGVSGFLVNMKKSFFFNFHWKIINFPMFGVIGADIARNLEYSQLGFRDFVKLGVSISTALAFFS